MDKEVENAKVKLRGVVIKAAGEHFPDVDSSRAAEVIAADVIGDAERRHQEAYEQIEASIHERVTRELTAIIKENIGVDVPEARQRLGRESFLVDDSSSLQRLRNGGTVSGARRG